MGAAGVAQMASWQQFQGVVAVVAVAQGSWQWQGAGQEEGVRAGAS